MNNFPTISKQIAKILKEEKKFSIFVHENPDCDALGAASALREMLITNKKEAKIVGLNKNLKTKLIDLFNLDLNDVSEEYINNSICIIVDTANKERVLGYNDNFKFKKIIRIDHHLFVEKISDIEWIDSSASSTCEMVGWLLIKNNFKINSNIVEYLYAGILTDTGKFMYSNVSTSTFELMKIFSDIGFDKQKVQEKLFINDIKNTLIDNKLRKRIKIDKAGFGYILLNKRISKKIGNQNLYDKVWLLSGIDEIKIWFYIYFNDEGNYWKGSLRSRSYNVNEIAKKFNGGGHKLASGFKLYSKKDVNKLINEIKKVLNNGK